MKIIYKKGDLLACEEPWILHGCNAQGKYNSGVAKLVRAKWPTAYHAYLASISEGGMQLGRVTFAEQDDGKTIFNGITQEFYGRVCPKQYVSYKALEDVMWCIDQHTASVGKFMSVAMPKIGAGLGGGDWEIISDIIERESFNFQPVVYEL